MNYSGRQKYANAAHLEPVLGLSVLGYYRNMAVQHGRRCGQGPAPYVDINGSFEGNVNILILFSGYLTVKKTYLLYSVSANVPPKIVHTGPLTKIQLNSDS